MDAGGSTRVVVAALAGNAAIAASKFVAAAFSGSAATLAEAVHSLADTGNQVLLLVGLRRSGGGPTARHPFGSAVEVYFWAFVVSLTLFTVGGAFAIYEGAHKLLDHPTLASGEPEGGNPLWSYAVLGLAFVFESCSCAVALREFRHLRGGRPALEAILETRDPTIPVVLLEDLAALVGLALALAGVSLAQATGWAGWDGIASVLIGLVLCAVAVLLARETHSLLLGESATEEDRREVRRLVDETPGVRRLTQLRSMHRGPRDVLLALKVDLGRDLSVAEVESTIDRLEARIREALPHMRHIFVEPDASGGRQPPAGGEGVNAEHGEAREGTGRFPLGAGGARGDARGAECNEAPLGRSGGQEVRRDDASGGRGGPPEGAAS